MAIPKSREQDPNKASQTVLPVGVFNANKKDQQEQEKKSANEYQAQASGNPKDTWKSLGNFSLSPLAGVSENENLRKTVNGLSDVIDTISTAIEILNSAGRIINAFQSDANNLFVAINFAIQAIVDTLKELAVSVSSTGVYVLPLIPEISPLNPDTSAGGGFQEIKAKVNHALTNRQDPNRPVFFEGDFLGSVIFLTSAGTNIGDLIKDLSILARFIRGEGLSSKISTVRSLNATPGLYPETQGESEGLYDTITDYLAAAVGVEEKYPGIKISWAAPEGVPGIYGYHIYRSKTQEGTPELDEEGKLKRVPDDSPLNAGRQIKKYIDFAFNGGEPVFMKEDNKSSWEFVDFEVLDGEVYYYKVVPLFKDSEGERVEGEVISQYTSAKASSCIPSDLLANTYETPDGLLKGKAEGDPPYWSNLTLRGLVGESLDSILRSTQSLADRLKGITVTASTHFNDLIDTLEGWLEDISKLLTYIRNILESLQSLQFSGSTMHLVIPSESGGVEGLKNRINKAGFSEDVQEFIDKNNSTCSLYGGLMFVVGSPTSSSFSKLGGASAEEISKIKEAGKFEQAQNQVARERKGFKDGVGEGEGNDGYGYSEDIMKAIINLFGGG